MKKILFSFLIVFLISTGFVHAAPLYRLERTILPETDSTYDLGTSTQAWRSFYANQICLTADTCRTTWPTGGSGSSFAFPFTVNSWGNSTTTTLGFLNGFLSTASSTISAPLRLSSLNQGSLYVGTNGLLQSTATTTVSCSGSTSCSPFTVIGSSPITISSTGGGGGSGTISTSTALANGQVDFSTGVNTIGNDSNFFWDNTNKRLGIGTTTPQYPLTVVGSTQITGHSSIGDGIPDNPQYEGSPANLNAIFNVSGLLNSGNCDTVVCEGIANYPQVTYTGTNPGVIIGFDTLPETSPSSTGPISNLLGISGQVGNYGTGDVATLEGLSFIAANFGNANVSDLAGAYITAANYGLTGKVVTNLYGSWIGADDTGSGSISTNVYSLKIDGNTNEGSVTNNYGLNIGNQAGVGTNNYSIFTGTGAVQFGDNVGISTTTPTNSAFPLSIGGVANFTTATSTFYGNGLNLTSGCYAIKGVCISGGGGGSGTVTSVATDGTLTGGTITTTGTLGINLANANSWTGLQSFLYSSSTRYSSFVTASTTNLVVNGSSFNNLLGTGLSNTSGTLGLTSNTISGVTLGSSLGLLSGSGGGISLDGPGSYNGSAARNISLNLANPNSWTVNQTFNYSSSTLYSTFNVASSTNLFAGSFTLATTSAGCAAFNATGGLLSTGVACGSGSGLTGTTGQVAYFSGTNTAVGTSTLFITPAGQVGFGTLTPTDVNANARLTVAGISSQDVIASTTDNTTLSDAIFRVYAPGSSLFLGSHGTNQITTQYNGIVVGGWGEIGAVNSTFGSSNGLLIGTRTTNTPIVFGTNSNERLRITGAGLLGIGTTTPLAALHVNSNSTNTTTLAAQATSSQTASILDVWSEAGNSLFNVFRSGRTSVGTSTSAFPFTIASTTAPQFSLSAGGGQPQITFGNEGGILFISTTTVAGLATTTDIASFNGNAGVTPGFIIPTPASLSGFSTSTPAATVDIYTSTASSTPLLLESVSGGGCLIIKDVAGSGYTQIYTQAGVQYSKVHTGTLTLCN